MLIAKTDHFTIERTPTNTFVLTNLITGETITLSDGLLYELNDAIMEALEELEGEEVLINLNSLKI